MKTIYKHEGVLRLLKKSRDKSFFWRIKTNSGSRIYLRIKYFRLSLNCYSNYIAIYDSFRAHNNSLIGKLCGYSKQSIEFISNEPYLTIELVSDSTFNRFYNRFNAYYKSKNN
jgi:hypothetical protein